MPDERRSAPVRWLMGLIVMVLVTEVPIRLLLAVPFIVDRVSATTTWDRAAELYWYRNWWWAWWEHGPDATASDGMYDPVLGWTPTDGPSDIDHGFRRTRPAEAAVPSPALRITLLGDSFTFGSEVGWQDTAAAMLQARRDDVAVTNRGVWGYGHDQMMLLYERDADALDADVVVLVGIVADIVRNRHRFFAYAKPRFTEVGGALVLPDEPLPTPPTMALRIFARLRSVDLLQVVAQRRHVRQIGEFAMMDEGAAIMVPVLDRWAADVRAHGAVPVFVSLPTPFDLDEQVRELGPLTSQHGRELYATWCAAQDFPCVDGWDHFEVGERDGAWVRARSHWNPTGQALAADVIEDTLVAAGLLPPRPLAAPSGAPPP